MKSGTFQKLEAIRLDEERPETERKIASMLVNSSGYGYGLSQMVQELAPGMLVREALVAIRNIKIEVNYAQ